ncbi:MAG TPA: ABC transporter permease [Candidatus Saccharimonadia bacterium]|nr:ABC transporter permease [Candidatus Saccharimonadia bacterium]
MFDTLKQDLRYGIRSLFAKPGFLIAAVATLALGIGANTAIFSVINGLLLKPLPYDDGERLVQVYNNYPKMGLDYAGTSIPDYFDRKEQAPALADLAMYTGQSFNLAASGTPERLVGLRATPSLFSTLRASAALGRVFGEAEAVAGSDKVVVLSHTAWKNNFAGDAQIVGRDVRLNGETFRVLGVMPESFVFPNRDTQLFIPFAFTDAQKSDDERGNEYSESIGRLAPGATIEQLHSQMDAIVARTADRAAAAGGEDAADNAAWFRNGNFFGRAKSLRDQWVGNLRPVLWLLQAVVGFVLLIACANVANLMLTRVTSRQKELSVRTALGAGRRRIARQLLIEALLIAAMGALAGILLAYWSIDLLNLLGLNNSQLSAQVGIDGTVLGFTLALAALTGIVFGLFPAFAQLGGKPYEVLKEGGRGNTMGRGARMTRATLVVVQMALAVTLLVGAGLLIKSFNRVMEQDPGFRRDGLITTRFDLPAAKYPDAPAQAQFYDRALAELRTIPGAGKVAYTSNLPFGGSTWTTSFNIEGRDEAAGESSPHGYGRTVDEQYFEALEVPVLQGRGFTAADAAGAPDVMVVDEYLAKKYFAKDGAVGKRILWNETADGKPRVWTIVGVVGTVKPFALADDVKKEAFYMSFRQYTVDNGFFVVKTDLATGGLAQPIRDAILRVDPEQPVYDVRTLDERIKVSLEGRKAPMVLLAIFAGVALLLSAIGIYGVLAFSVEQRTSELGVRLAIGAQGSDITRLVLHQGGRIAGIGLALGIVGSLVLTRFMQSQLFGVQSSDPVTLVTVVLVLGAVALLACWLPARRAARTSPMEALRYE